MAIRGMVPALLVLVLSGEAYAASEWATFTSRYSGCSVDYPRSIFHPSQQRDPDGATSFTSNLARASMVLAGGSNDMRAPVAGIMRTYLEQVKGESITYRRQEIGWAVYSGYRDGSIYYLKVILSSNRRKACVLELKYPPANKGELDISVSRISRSLRVAVARR
jgi:hypothetical protein